MDKHKSNQKPKQSGIKEEQPKETKVSHKKENVTSEATDHRIDYLTRRIDFTPKIKHYLIACEGEKTEPQYFEALSEIWKILIDVETFGWPGRSIAYSGSCSQKTGGKSPTCDCQKGPFLFTSDC